MTRTPRPCESSRSPSTVQAWLPSSYVMKICRFNQSQIGVVDGQVVFDVTELFDRRPTWPLPQSEWVIRQIPHAIDELTQRYKDFPQFRLTSVRLASPVANPGKIVGAPINYRAHIAEANADREIHHGRTFTSIDQYGLFLKANSSLIGP